MSLTSTFLWWLGRLHAFAFLFCESPAPLCIMELLLLSQITPVSQWLIKQWKHLVLDHFTWGLRSGCTVLSYLPIPGLRLKEHLSSSWATPTAERRNTEDWTKPHGTVKSWAWMWHMSLLLTFYWLEQVSWPALAVGWGNLLLQRVCNERGMFNTDTGEELITGNGVIMC